MFYEWESQLFRFRGERRVHVTARGEGLLQITGNCRGII